MITLIAACSKNRVIGNNNKLIWHVPGDLKRFKELTSGHTVLMGRKTFESIGKPLPNRRNVILSRDQNLKIEGCFVYSSLTEVLELFGNDLFIIGGEEIYKQTIGYADFIELTLINKEFEGDAFFPEIPSHFTEIKSRRQNLECDEFKYSYITYEHVKHLNHRLANIDLSHFPEELFGDDEQE
jgi:dihydrofolate reductase